MPLRCEAVWQHRFGHPIGVIQTGIPAMLGHPPLGAANSRTVLFPESSTGQP